MNRREIIDAYTAEYLGQLTPSVRDMVQANADLQIDIVSAIVRIEQCAEMLDRAGPLDSLFYSIFDRLRTCDIPRLKRYVTSPEVRAYLVASVPMEDTGTDGQSAQGVDAQDDPATQLGNDGAETVTPRPDAGTPAARPTTPAAGEHHPNE